jgi:hypothetical protein
MQNEYEQVDFEKAISLTGKYIYIYIFLQNIIQHVVTVTKHTFLLFSKWITTFTFIKEVVSIWCVLHLLILIFV